MSALIQQPVRSESLYSLISIDSWLVISSSSSSSHTVPNAHSNSDSNSNSNSKSISSSNSISNSVSHVTISSSTHSASIPSTSKSSPTYLTSLDSVTSSHSTARSTSSFYSPSSSPQPTSTNNGAFIGGGASGGGSGSTGTGSGAISSSTAISGNNSSSDSGPATPTPVIIGSVVSSVAGAAVIILAVLFIWRWRKRNRNMVSLGSIGGGPSDGADAIHGGPPSQPSGGMAERRSFIHAVPAALASLSGYKRSSQQTETNRTVSTTAGSERGFYRVSGRKLPSVLQSGGDGYGDEIDEVRSNTLSGTSFYRDSRGFYGGTGSLSNPLAGTSTQRESGIPVMRPSPARTPVTEHGPFGTIPPPLSPPARRPDLLGRSHPSQDGSRGSKFTEQV